MLKIFIIEGGTHAKISFLLKKKLIFKKAKKIEIFLLHLILKCGYHKNNEQKNLKILKINEKIDNFTILEFYFFDLFHLKIGCFC